MKKVFLHGLVAGLIAALACIVFDRLYCFLYLADFSPVINIMSMTSACLVGTMLASLGYYFFAKFVKNRYTDVIFNIIFTMLTFASLYPAMYAKLPETIDPMLLEFFFGLVAPMHLMPQLFWVSTKAIFYAQETPFSEPKA